MSVRTFATDCQRESRRRSRRRHHDSGDGPEAGLRTAEHPRRDMASIRAELRRVDDLTGRGL
jgi:hypothetical protein